MTSSKTYCCGFRQPKGPPGSWSKTGCDPERPGSLSLRVGVNLTNAGKPVRSYIEKAAKLVEKIYGEVGISLRFIFAEENQPCEIAVTFRNAPRTAGAPIAGSGWPKGGCQQVKIYVAHWYSPPATAWMKFARMLAHEIGHAMGLEHSKERNKQLDMAGIMDPYLPNTTTLPTWKGDPSRPLLVAIAGRAV